MTRLIIFDFDGVIADSEVLSNTVLAEAVTRLGLPTTLEESFRRHMGKRFRELMLAVETSVGRPLPHDFADTLQVETLARFRRELRAVDGLHRYLDAFAHVPRCIASSSSPDRLACCMEILDLTRFFGSRVYSAAGVARGKPHPDIFLHAAERMAADPTAAIVLEDSIRGVQAGVAAGMTVIGMLAASHVRDGDGARLKQAGAHHVAKTFQEAEAITRTLLDPPARGR